MVNNSKLECTDAIYAETQCVRQGDQLKLLITADSPIPQIYGNLDYIPWNGKIIEKIYLKGNTRFCYT